MKINRFLKLSVLTASLAFVGSSTQTVLADHHETASEAHGAGKDIVAVASGDSNFKTLVAALKAAGLVETLQGKGPFTVFAPTNAAFGKLPAGTVDNLVKPENKATLTKILTYHVVAGKLDAADLTDGKKLKTVEGEELM